jgi:16S rRNA (guanine1516-N2)-methyltransferase
VLVIVTTPLRPPPDDERAAREAAARHGLPYAPRGQGALEKVLAAAGAGAALVLSPRSALLATAVASQRWSAGMGILRMRRTLARLGGRPVSPTDRDPFLEAAGIRPGDEVLDATLGLGADALVAAAACGPGGRVVALEGSRPLAAWVAEGLRRLDAEPARRIEVRAGDHLAALGALTSRSFDVVVFDPMFRHGRPQPGGFELVRALADPRPVSAEAVAEARRVARRWVLVKDGAPGWDLARLGLTPLPSARGAHRYYARVAPG